MKSPNTQELRQLSDHVDEAYNQLLNQPHCTQLKLRYDELQNRLNQLLSDARSADEAR